MDQDQHLVGEDQRGFLRVPLIVYRIRLDDGRRSFFGYSCNIGRGGLFISTVSPREPGSRFAVEIPLPPPFQRLLRCHCEVTWTRPYDPRSTQPPGMGLKFLDLADADGEALEAWIKTLPE